MKSEDFELLFQAHAQSLFAFLVYRTGDRALAEDVLSDAFERALRSRRSFDRDKGDGKTWLFAIALNRLRDLQRRADVERRAVGHMTAAISTHEPAFEDRLVDGAAVRAALFSLPDNERDVLALRYGADLTVPEIARLTSEPLSRVEGRVYRGLRKIRERLDA